MRRRPRVDGRVFVDTAAYVALALEEDGNHRRAVAIVRDLGRQRFRLFTTNFVVAETHAFLVNRAGRAVALRTLVGIVEGTNTIIRVEEEDELGAMAILAKYDDKDFGRRDELRRDGTTGDLDRVHLRPALPAVRVCRRRTTVTTGVQVTSA